MTDTDGSSPLAAVAGGDGERAVAAFAALADETRLAILVALWEAHDPTDPDAGVPFSDLRERVGTSDSGRFNYHLGKLADQYVRDVDGGYAITRVGRQVVRTVVAGSGIDAPSLTPTEIDVACPLCGAGTVVSYEDGWIYEVCTECQGAFGGGEAQPDGYLAGMPLDPAGLPDRTAEELWAAAYTRMYNEMRTAAEGICHECSGPVERTVKICSDHTPDEGDGGVCPTCNRRSCAIVILGCDTCRHYHATSPGSLVTHHPAVISFYQRRGVPLQYETGEFDRVRRRRQLTAQHETTVLDTDPIRVSVTVRHDDDELEVTLDGSASVLSHEVSA